MLTFRTLREQLEIYRQEPLSDVVIPQFKDEDFAYELLLSQREACNSSARLWSSIETMQPVQNNAHCASNKQKAQVKRKRSSGNKKAAENKEIAIINGNGNSHSTVSKKDPLAPKKPVNAYFLFCDHKRTSVHAALSNVLFDIFLVQVFFYCVTF